MMVVYRSLFFYLFTAFFISAYADSDTNCQSNSRFNIGVGIYDITGPAAEASMTGYGMLQQQTAGISQRLWARAFIIESPCSNKRIVFVNTDLCQLFQGIKQQVIQKLQAKYGNLYGYENVLLTAMHTHSGPGGYSTYTFYNLPTLGFNKTYFGIISDGIVKAIERAQANLAPGYIRYAEGDILSISHNRSPQAYLQNPENERANYPFDFDTQMQLVRFENLSHEPIGLINWFPIHPVSINNKNKLISGDNKGYAEYLFEKDFHSNYDEKSFVAAFAQANAGDVSPNPYGHEGGTGDAGRILAEKAGFPQYAKAKELFNNPIETISGDIDYRHTFIPFDHVEVDPLYANGHPQHTCKAAIGISMLAGTQDGEGVGKQGITCEAISRIIPQFVCNRLTTQCQGVKPIVLPTGSFEPYPWTPNIMPLQVFKIGNIVIAAIPFEISTMTGRRIRKAIASQLPDPEHTHIILTALANTYTGYVATPEEYQIQRYEGASTHFGPWTAAALQQEFAKLMHALITGNPVERGPIPPDLSDTQINLQPGVISDKPPHKKHFGDVKKDVKSHYHPGDIVKVVFWGAHPKNNYRIQDTFLAVQRLENNQWRTVREDRDWDTEYHWERHKVDQSLITIIWRIPNDIAKGTYRILHQGDAKNFLNGDIHSYQGTSAVFNVS